MNNKCQVTASLELCFTPFLVQNDLQVLDKC